jgi:hypothetical protein
MDFVRRRTVVVVFNPRRDRRISKPRRSWSRGPGSREEQLVSMYAIAVVEAFLLIFLLVGAYRGLSLMRGAVHELGWHIRYGLPVVMAVVALVVLKALTGNVRRIIELHKMPPVP